MNKEQAVEIVLREKPFVDCAPCFGTGYTNTPLSGKALCQVCDAHGSTLSAIYAEACRVLQRPPPENIMGLWTRAAATLSVQSLTADLSWLALGPRDER